MTKAKRKTLPKNLEAILAEGEHAKIIAANATVCAPRDRITAGLGQWRRRRVG